MCFRRAGALPTFEACRGPHLRQTHGSIVNIGSFTGEVASNIQAEAFDYLDAPVLRVGAKNGIAPQSHILEAVFLPTADDIVAAAKSIL